jgi:hypothetical protein
MIVFVTGAKAGFGAAITRRFVRDLEFYRLFPQRVRALVLADTFAQLDDEERRQARYDTAERLLREGMERYAPEVLPKMIAPRIVRERPEVAAHVLSMMRTTSPRGAVSRFARAGGAARLHTASTANCCSVAYRRGQR